VSHELRSPLTSIYSFSTLIADGLAGEVAPQQEEFLLIIMRNVRQLLAMIEDLLQDSQLRAGKLHFDLQRASIRESIEYAVDTLRGVRENKDINLSFQVSEGLPPAYADPMRLRQVLTILLDNAVKFTPKGGEVQARAALSETPGFLLVEVSDSGCGIDPAAIAHLRAALPGRRSGPGGTQGPGTRPAHRERSGDGAGRQHLGHQ
jgi:signal transduction histidine kinase